MDVDGPRPAPDSPAISQQVSGNPVATNTLAPDRVSANATKGADSKMDVDGPGPALESPAISEQVSKNPVATNSLTPNRASANIKDRVTSKMGIDNPSPSSESPAVSENVVAANLAVGSPAPDHNVSTTGKDSRGVGNHVGPGFHGSDVIDKDSVGGMIVAKTAATVSVASDVDVEIELPAFMPNLVAIYLRGASLSTKWHQLLREYFQFESEDPPSGVRCFFFLF